MCVYSEIASSRLYEKDKISTKYLEKCAAKMRACDESPDEKMRENIEKMMDDVLYVT